MGEYTKLIIKNINICSGKEDSLYFINSLFQKDDFKIIDESFFEGEEIVENFVYGYHKQIKYVKNRLNLLGYNKSKTELMYNLGKSFDYKISFEMLVTAMNSLDFNTSKIKTKYSDDIIFQKNLILKEYLYECFKPYFESEYEFEHYYNSIGLFTILYIISSNEKNQDLELDWICYDEIPSFKSNEGVIKSLDYSQKILIVTEGSTDSDIIKKAMEILHPEVYDLFHFVDMEKNYPFTGTGNLGNFFKGLIKIKSVNKILFILDNDVAGNEKYNELDPLERLNNLKLCKLPYMDDFTNMHTIGPNGKSISDINGKAASIECFLDFSSIDEPTIRWTGYNQKMNEYQGEIIQKKELQTAFYNRNGNYNFEKLKKLTDYIIDYWVNH